jgi:hypothetical protein
MQHEPNEQNPIPLSAMDHVFNRSAIVKHGNAQSAVRSEGQVREVIRAAFLAPELVEALLQGRRPARLTLRGVMSELPWD